MAIIESCAIIHVLQGTEVGRRIHDELKDEIAGTTAICVNEVCLGLTLNQKASAGRFFAELDILPFDEKAAYRSVEIEQSLYKKGKPIGKLDIMIASICMANDLTLITTEAGFKNVEGLKLILVA